jgi:thioredoxin-related protein
MFRNDPPLAIKRSDIQGKPTFQANIVLKVVTNQQQDQQNVPSRPAFPAEKDSEFLDAQGNTVRLSEIFRGEYLLLDFSQPGCSACISMAEELTTDQEFMRAFALEGSKCSMATVVPQSQRSGWLSMFSATDMIGRHSVFPAGGFSEVAGKFGERITATPTFLLIDRSGNVVGKSAGGLPDNARQLCR